MSKVLLSDIELVMPLDLVRVVLLVVGEIVVFRSTLLYTSNIFEATVFTISFVSVSMSSY